jgi:hypothetical protein
MCRVASGMYRFLHIFIKPLGTAIAASWDIPASLRPAAALSFVKQLRR